MNARNTRMLHTALTMNQPAMPPPEGTQSSLRISSVVQSSPDEKSPVMTTPRMRRRSSRRTRRRWRRRWVRCSR